MSGRPPDAAFAARLRVFDDKLAALERRLQLLEHQVRRPTDTDLLAVIATATDGRAFSAIELQRHARRVDPVLLAHLHRVAAVSTRQTGKLLARLSKEMHGNYRLTRVGRDGVGTIWEVRVHVSESDLHAHPRIGLRGGV